MAELGDPQLVVRFGCGKQEVFASYTEFCAYYWTKHWPGRTAKIFAIFSNGTVWVREDRIWEPSIDPANELLDIEIGWIDSELSPKR